MLFICAHCGQPGASRSNQAFGSQVCDDSNTFIWHHPSCLGRKTIEEHVSYETQELRCAGGRRRDVYGTVRISFKPAHTNGGPGYSHVPKRPKTPVRTVWL